MAQHDVKDKKRGLGWADWILLILFSLAVFFCVCFIRERKQQALPTVGIQYTVCITDLDRTLLGEAEDPTALIPLRTTVTNENGTAKLGHVLSVELVPYEIAVSTSDGIAFVEDPDKAKLLVTVRAEGSISPQEGVRVQDIRIAAGGTGGFRFGRFYAERCTVRYVAKEGTR